MITELSMIAGFVVTDRSSGFGGTGMTADSHARAIIAT